MPTLALALSMLALEQGVTERREQAAIDPDPAPLEVADGRDDGPEGAPADPRGTVRGPVQAPAGG